MTSLASRSSRIFNPLVLSSVLAVGTLAIGACGEDDHDHEHGDEAHLMFVTAPGTTLTAGEDAAVTWMVHTEGDLHHTEIRACMGHSDECGLGDTTSFDLNFTGTMGDDMYSTDVNIDTAGPWTIVVYAHVGETPHISDAIHATVE
ncbi:MAG: hypothetical protein GY811_01275 [Myxococcales bacterium]|nr:hypothetical protein [Myxococcales bacterium]